VAPVDPSYRLCDPIDTSYDCSISVCNGPYWREPAARIKS